MAVRVFATLHKYKCGFLGAVSFATLRTPSPKNVFVPYPLRRFFRFCLFGGHVDTCAKTEKTATTCEILGNLYVKLRAVGVLADTPAKSSSSGDTQHGRLICARRGSCGWGCRGVDEGARAFIPPTHPGARAQSAKPLNQQKDTQATKKVWCVRKGRHGTGRRDRTGRRGERIVQRGRILGHGGILRGARGGTFCRTIPPRRTPPRRRRKFSFVYQLIII